MNPLDYPPLSTPVNNLFPDFETNICATAGSSENHTTNSIFSSIYPITDEISTPICLSPYTLLDYLGTADPCVPMTLGIDRSITTTQETSELADSNSIKDLCLPSLKTLKTVHSLEQSQPLIKESAIEEMSPTKKPSSYKPPQDNNDLYIRIGGIPKKGAKSRVETQIKLSIQLLTKKGTCATSWRYLRLPEKTLTRSKLQKSLHSSFQDKYALDLHTNDSEILDMEARVVCESDPHKKVEMCARCVRRERKRAERRRSSKINTFHHLASEHQLDSNAKNTSYVDSSYEIEKEKVLLLSSDPLMSFSSGEATLSLRITCYCRHHRERTGFRVLFFMRDSTGTIIATGKSPSIMITDDHKSIKSQVARKKEVSEADIFTAKRSFRQKQCQQSGSLFTTLSEFSSSFQISPPPTPEACSPFSTHSHSKLYDNEDHPSTLPYLKELTLPFASTESYIPSVTSRTIAHTKETLANQHPSFQNTTLCLPPMHYPSHTISPPPLLELIVPTNGFTYGGTEVTLLGSGFSQDSVCYFGDQAAVPFYWSPTTLICLLPPVSHPGPVVVTLQSPSIGSTLNSKTTTTVFDYYEPTEQAFIELALQVIGMKMTGKLQDAKQIAMHVIRHGCNMAQSLQPQALPSLLPTVDTSYSNAKETFVKREEMFKRETSFTTSSYRGVQRWFPV
ncbi:hypothetical protein BDF14DRAFT_1848855 [Spinellus fusiger]|nr:hypothetical protein BDF14DRAFT_1848855 [Spinellus fusiger]